MFCFPGRIVPLIRVGSEWDCTASVNSWRFALAGLGLGGGVGAGLGQQRAADGGGGHGAGGAP